MKLAILDKDGTLVLPKSGNTFVQNPTDQILMVGVVEACRRLIEAGYVLAIASNQGGVEAGFKTLDDAIKEMKYCRQLLERSKIQIDRTLFCPDFEGKICIVAALDVESLAKPHPYEKFSGEFRKPNGGMLKALKGTDKFEDCWMIGDREEDRLAAEAAGFNFLDNLDDKNMITRFTIKDELLGYSQ